MRDIAVELRRWWDAGEPFALATVVGVSRSAPRAPGAAMAVGPDGVVVGSVSGGCVEGAVYELASEVLESGGQTPGVPAAQLTTYGYSDETAFAVGLTCGGQISLLVERIDAVRTPEFGALLADVEAGRPVAVAQVLAIDPDVATTELEVGARLTVRAEGASGSLGTSGLDAAVTDDAQGLLSQGQTAQRHYGPHGERRLDEVTVFVASYAPAPRMLVFGAIDFAAAVARIGVFLGYRVTVCDARPVFATARRFPDAHEVVVEWPHRYLARSVAAGAIDPRTVICVLTHDPKFDVPLLEVALRSSAGYVGAMGSRRTHDERMRLLQERGVTQGELARLHSPIGLDIGARTPEETAVSVAAEIIRSRWGGSGRPLLATSGPIHGELDREAAPALVPAEAWDDGALSPTVNKPSTPIKALDGSSIVSMSVCGIVLAAGAGSRMGQPKATLELEGRTLLARALSMLSDAGCTPLVAVLGATVPPDGGYAMADFVSNPDWESGMASSLRAGLGAAQGSAAVVALVDQPGITSDAVSRLIASHRPGFASVATFNGELRTPVLFDEALWDEVAASVSGDAGARHWLRRNLPRVIPVACDDVADPSDLDLPEDLTGWEHS